MQSEPVQTRRRSQKERTEETRRRLIEATIAALLEVGAGGATVTEICRRAEVTSGAIQHHFGDKAGLMTAVVVELFQPFANERSPRGASAPLSQRIARLVDHYWRIYGDPRYFAVLEVLLATRHDAALMALVSHYRDQQLDMLRAFLPVEFPDVALTDEAKHRVVSRMIDFLRGASVRRLYETGEALDAEILDAARDMIARRFQPVVKEP